MMLIAKRRPDVKRSCLPFCLFFARLRLLSYSSKKALKWHPDKNRDDPKKAEERFKIVSEAYEVRASFVGSKYHQQRSFSITSRLQGLLLSVCFCASRSARAGVCTYICARHRGERQSQFFPFLTNWGCSLICRSMFRQ